MKGICSEGWSSTSGYCDLISESASHWYLEYRCTTFSAPRLVPTNHPNLKYYRSQVRLLEHAGLTCDPIVIENNDALDDTLNLKKAVRPAMEHLWREGGLEHDPYLAKIL